jgi:hypothetical protein
MVDDPGHDRTVPLDLWQHISRTLASTFSSDHFPSPMKYSSD